MKREPWFTSQWGFFGGQQFPIGFFLGRNSDLWSEFFALDYSCILDSIEFKI
jgi:hypothetical protein